MTTHPSAEAIARYAAADPALDDVEVWSVEAHLEACGHCRAVLAAAADEATRALRDQVAMGIDHAITAGPPPLPYHRTVTRRGGAAWVVVPWVLMVAGMLLTAAVSGSLFPSLPSLVLMAAPVAPLVAVAGAWTKGTDPAWELVSSAPRAGLRMVLTRALAVLAPMVPVLAVLHAVSGNPLVLWLLPCLAFTAASLALGSLVGVARASGALALAWGAGVVVPSMVTGRVPAVLQPGNWAGWALLTVALGLVTAARRDAFVRLSSRH